MAGIAGSAPPALCPREGGGAGGSVPVPMEGLGRSSSVLALATVGLGCAVWTYRRRTEAKLERAGGGRAQGQGQPQRWRVSAPGQRTAAAVYDYCLAQLRREYNGETEGLLTDQRRAAGTAVQPVPLEACQSIVTPWERADEEGAPPAARGGCEWVLPQQQGGATAGRRILYCHGGGYTGCTPAEYRGLTTRLAAATGLPLFIFDYRKAPEHPFPAAVDDAQTALAHVCAHGPDGPGAATEVILMGDSAGGGLALGLLLRLGREGRAAATALRLVTISAYTDLRCSTPSYDSRVWREDSRRGDVCFSSGDAEQDRQQGRVWAQQYAARPEHATHPEAAPYYASDGALGALPPTLMVVGDEESMLSESTELAARARAAGADLTLSVYPRMWHVWPMYSEACRCPEPGAVLCEAEEALAQIAAWCRA